MPEQDFQARFMVTVQGYGWPEREKPKVKQTLEEIICLAFGENAQVTIARAAPQRSNNSNGHEKEIELCQTTPESATLVKPKKKKAAMKSTPPSPKSTKRSRTNRPSSDA